MEDEDLTTEQPNDSELIKKLRGEVKRSQKTNKQLTSQLNEMRSTNMIHEAGVSNLNERQKRAVLRELGELDGEPSADDVKEIIKDLGYGQSQGQGQQQVQGEQVPQQGLQQVDQNQTQQPVQPGGVGDDFTSPSAPNVDPNQFNPMNQQAPSPQQQSAQAMMNMQANQMQQTTGAPSLEEQIKAAKTPEELRDLVRNQGPAAGMKHQWDA